MVCVADIVIVQVHDHVWGPVVWRAASLKGPDWDRHLDMDLDLHSHLMWVWMCLWIQTQPWAALFPAAGVASAG